MKTPLSILEEQLEDYSSQSSRLTAYIAELKRTTDQYDTERVHFEDDLMEAEHNLTFYTAEIARIKKEISDSTTPRLGNIARPGVLSLVLTPISFIAGALLGSKLSRGRSSRGN